MNPYMNCIRVLIFFTNDGIMNVRACLYCLSCDTPARSAVMNMNQHNGACCCPKCIQPGKNLRTDTGGNIRVFPYQVDNPLGPERKTVVSDAYEADNTGKVVNGIKGPSFFMFCPNFDPVKNVGIDTMHLLFLGTVRLLLKLWFNVSSSTQIFSLYKEVDIVDNRLSNIKPSHFITRTPRNISDNLKFWKAAELRSWFFYYSIPCLMDLMKPNYFYHFCSFVEAIVLLNSASISENDIVRSEKLLQYFVFMMPNLYDERYMTINVHSLVHLPQMVRELGPLWSSSCFPFESASGDLLKLFHGTQCIDIQIVNAVHVFNTLPFFYQEIDEGSPEFKLVASLTKKQKKHTDNFEVCGKGYGKTLSLIIKGKLCLYFNKPVFEKDVLFYKRAYIRGIMYHSSEYTRVTKRN